MLFLEYFSEHPDRVRRLNTSTEFFESCGPDPVYVDSKRVLVDILTLSTFIRVHGGTKLENALAAMETYLRGEGLRHPKDTYEGFVSACKEIKTLHKSDSGDQLVKRDSSSKPLPFFVRPETAYGFMRYHLRSSAELYGQLLPYTSELISPHLREMIIDAMDKMKKKSYVAWYLASRGVTLKLQAREVVHPVNPVEHQLDVVIRTLGNPPEHAKFGLSVKQGEVVIPKLKSILGCPEVVKYLPGFSV